MKNEIYYNDQYLISHQLPDYIQNSLSMRVERKITKSATIKYKSKDYYIDHK